MYRRYAAGAKSLNERAIKARNIRVDDAHEIPQETPFASVGIIGGEQPAGQLQNASRYKKLHTCGSLGPLMRYQLSNLRHLSVYCAVTRLGSVSAAARAAHMTQPAVTQAIASLEREFGGRLFARTAAGMEPTAGGGLCARRVAHVLERLAEALPMAAVGSSATGRTVHGITSRQLLALVAVVEAGGFGAAARTLGTTRAALHRPARDLERKLAIALFEVTSHGLRPTREAQRVCLQVQLAIAELAQARAEVRAGGGTERGATVVGAMPLARSRLLPRAVLRFARTRPHHRISILDGPYESLLDELRRGRADVLIGALRETVPADVHQERLFDDPLALIVRRGHPLVALSASGRRAPPLAALARFPWIAPRVGSPLRQHFDRLLGTLSHSPPAAAVECNSLIAARALLLSSERIMLLSAQQVSHELAAGELVALPHPAGRVVRAIGLTLRKDWRPTEAQTAFIETLRQVIGSAEVGEDCARAWSRHRVAGKRGGKAASAV